MSSQQDAKPADPAPVLKEAQDKLSRELAQIVRGTRITLFAGIVLAVVIAGYLHYILGMIAPMVAEPDTVAVLVRQQVEPQIPEVMAELEASLSENAPAMVADARATLMRRIPAISTAAQDRLAVYIAGEVAASVDDDLDRIVETVIRDSKKEIDAIVDKSLEKGGAAKLQAEFEKLFADAIGESLDVALAETNTKLAGHREHLHHLRTAEKLNPWEEDEKELVTSWVILISKALEDAAEQPAEKVIAAPM